jgi:hypothetical protein
MDILLGGLIGIAATVVGWFLNSRTARDAQQRQRKYDLEMQEQSLQAERQKGRDEALREARRDRLQPVFELLRELEQTLAYRLSEESIQAFEAAVGLDSPLAPAVAGGAPDGARRTSREVLQEMVAELRRDIPPAPKDLVTRAASVILRIGDEDLRNNLLMVCVAASSGDYESRVFANMAIIHARLEAYAVAIDDPRETLPQR